MRFSSHYFINIPTQRPVNPKTNTNWEGHGVMPDIEAAPEESFAVAYRKALDVLSRKDDLAGDEAEEIRQALREISWPSLPPQLPPNV